VYMFNQLLSDFININRPSNSNSTRHAYEILVRKLTQGRQVEKRYLVDFFPFQLVHFIFDLRDDFFCEHYFFHFRYS
jgi:hypothetical protein